MTDLGNTLAAMSGDGVRIEFGTAYWSGSAWYANVRGKLLTARWLDPIQPLQGGSVVVALSKDLYGQSTAIVLGGITDQPRPSTGTVEDVIPAGVATQIVFIGDDGKEYTTERFIGSYAPGAAVYLQWDAAQPTIIGAVPTSTVTPEAPPPQPPAAPVTGRADLIATASDTWWGPGGWGSWATSRNGGETVYSGSQGGQSVTGAWFYGAAKPELQGKTVTHVTFRLPARLPGTGAYNDAVTIYLYPHTSGSRPGGDVTRVGAAYPVSVPAGFGGGDIDLPPYFGPYLAGGGGISIAGGPYVGFASRLSNAENGKITMDWST